MIGRYQPWHAGHHALFKKAFEKYGQVYIMVRDMPISEDNPYTTAEVIALIEKDLTNFEGRYEVTVVPNVSAVVYGRDVGYKIEEISLPPHLEQISATAIRRGKSNETIACDHVDRRGTGLDSSHADPRPRKRSRRRA
jgi:hypothetical protein